MDFYVFTQSQYSDYTNPNVPRFGYEEARENANAFTYTVTTSGRIVVIDNDDISTSGASPTGAVTYTLTVVFENAPPIALYAAIFLIALVAIVAVAVVVRRRRRAAMPPPMQPPMQPPYQPPQAPPPP